MSPSTRSLVSSCGFEVSPTSGLIDPVNLNYVAIIGGLLYRGAQIDSVVREYILRAGKTPINLLGICTGSFVLCRLGLCGGNDVALVGIITTISKVNLATRFLQPRNFGSLTEIGSPVPEELAPLMSQHTW